MSSARAGIVVGDTAAERLFPLFQKAITDDDDDDTRSITLSSSLLADSDFRDMALAIKASEIRVRLGSVVVECDVDVSRFVLGNERFAALVEREFSAHGVVLQGVRFVAATSAGVGDASRVARVGKFLVARVSGATLDDASVARGVGRSLKKAIVNAGLAKDSFFALCSTPSLPFILEKVREKYRAETAYMLKGLGLKEAATAVDSSQFQRAVVKYAHAKGDNEPAYVTTFSLTDCPKTTGVLVVHAQTDEALERIRPILESFATFGPFDDLPLVRQGEKCQPDGKTAAGHAGAVYVDLAFVDLGGGAFERLWFLLAQDTVRCVDLSAAKGLTAEMLSRVLALEHVLYVGVSRCAEAVLMACFNDDQKLFQRKAADVEHVACVLETNTSTLSPLRATLRDVGKLRRWRAMSQLHSASYLLEN
jgi:hypothetical protein